jgi:polysaccharide export outer membrane protein
MRNLALVTLLVLSAHCGPMTRTLVDKSAPAPAADTTLGVGDTFEVRIYGEADLSGVYRVGAEGSINFPLAGEVKVAGLDPAGVAKRIADRLADGILRNPQVTVLVKEQTSKKIHIIGQVARPGTITYTPSMSVVEAITLSGGFTPLAAKNDTTVTRFHDGLKTIQKCPVEDIGQGKAQNVYLKPGDIINVPERLF